MAVASTRLAIGSLSSAAIATVFTAPAAKRTIVKSIVVRNAGTAGAVAVTIVPAVGSSATYNIWCTASSTSGDSPQTLPWIVLDPGDVLRLTYPTASGGWYVISGTELLL